MGGKILAIIIGFAISLAAFTAMAGNLETDTQGTPENVISRVAPATDGTHASLPGNQPNGICYVWEQAEAFNPSVTVATFGTNTKGIAIDTPGFWNYWAAYDQCSGDAGSVWDAWAINENAVMIYEVFDDQSTTGRNYTMIYEDQMEGDGGTGFGGGAVPVAPNILTPIPDPVYAWGSAGNSSCCITIGAQTTGFEVPALFDGYGVWKSLSPITQANQGTSLGDATLEGGQWVYRDMGWTEPAYYAVKVKWDGGTYPFYAPLYSYGMSNDLFVSGKATGLNVVKSGASDVLITWTNPNASNFWDVYAGTDKTSVKQPANLLGTVPSGVGTYTHVGAQTDGNTWYYLVIGRDEVGTESENSTMGVKLNIAMAHNSPPRTNIMWITIPQDSGYDTASDIVIELEGALMGPGLDSKINVVGKWVPSGQYSTCFVYDSDFEEWTGDDFTIGPGDAIYLSITSSFNWVVCGIDTNTMLSFTHNSLPKTNIMWFNLPATCSYVSASDIVMELEGALMGPGLDTKINVVGMWMPGYQSSTPYLYDGIFEEWTGDDFTITSGYGIYISVTSSFTWTPALITPVVP